MYSLDSHLPLTSRVRNQLSDSAAHYIHFKRNPSYKVAAIHFKNVPKLALDSETFVKLKSHESQFHSITNTHRNPNSKSYILTKNKKVKVPDISLIKYPTVGVTVKNSRFAEYPPNTERANQENTDEDSSFEKNCSNCKKKDIQIKQMNYMLTINQNAEKIKSMELQITNLTKENAILRTNICKIENKEDSEYNKIAKENKELKTIILRLNKSSLVQSDKKNKRQSSNGAVSKFEIFQTTMNSITASLSILSESLNSDSFINEMYQIMEEHEVMDRAYKELKHSPSKIHAKKQSSEYMGLAKKLMEQLATEDERKILMDNVLSQHNVLDDNLKGIMRQFEEFIGFMNSFFNMAKCDYLSLN